MLHSILVGLPGGWELIIILAIIFIPSIFWIWALIDVIKSEFSPQQNKVIWILVVALLPFIGSLLYFFIGRNQKVVG
jgi:hypothetical protein